MSRFKKCPNGHTYKAELSECPICNSSKHVGVPKSNSQATQIINSLDGETFGLKTATDDEPIQVQTGDIDPHKDFSKTMVEEEVMEEDESGNIVATRRESRPRLRLVGWLVTFSLDEFGVDFRLYEGRNYIGKNFECNICINDSKVSGQHAILLYRGGKFKIKDNLSTNGTIINGEDIDDETYDLQDGDVIQVGETTLLFRTAFIPNE